MFFFLHFQFLLQKSCLTKILEINTSPYFKIEREKKRFFLKKRHQHTNKNKFFPNKKKMKPLTNNNAIIFTTQFLMCSEGRQLWSTLLARPLAGLFDVCQPIVCWHRTCSDVTQRQIFNITRTL